MGVLRKLITSGLLVGDKGQANFETLVSHRNLDAIMRLRNYYGLLLSGEDRQLNYEALMRHDVPHRIAQALCQLRPDFLTGNLGTIHRHALIGHSSPHFLAAAINAIEPYYLSEDHDGYLRRKMILKGRNPRDIPSHDEHKLAFCIYKAMNKGLSYKAALTYAVGQHDGMIYLLMLLLVKQGRPFLQANRSLPPRDVWKLIFSFLTPLLTPKDYEQLALVEARERLCTQLTMYQKNAGAVHKSRATSLCAAISEAPEKQVIQELMGNQQLILRGTNPYGFFDKVTPHHRDIKPVVDGFYRIVEQWGSPNLEVASAAAAASGSLDGENRQSCVIS